MISAKTAALAAALTIGVGVPHAQAQYTGQLQNWKEPANLRPKMTCASLRGLTTYDFAIETATLVPAASGVAEFCHVKGNIPPEIRFEVSLPTAWNGRFYMFGNGGFAGESFTSRNRLYKRDNGVNHGFAVAATNTGHDGQKEPGASFALNPQKLIDFQIRSAHVTATTAKTIIRGYYETAPNKSYYEGCSEGGRQGMLFAQRYPDDFDGLALGSGVINYTGNYVDGRNRALAMERGPVTLDNIKLVADVLYGKCDGKDGLVDGLINDPRRCEFNVTTDVPRCQAGTTGASCLTERQAQSFQQIYTGVVVNGQQWYPGLPPAAEVFAPTGEGEETKSGWDPWQIGGDDPIKGNKRTWGESFFKYMAVPGREVDYKTFDPNTDLDKLEPLGDIMNAMDPDLTRFKARGGKILQSWGFAEPALNPIMGIDYYESVRKTIGPGTADFFRLFMIPGGFHCGGGVGITDVDTFTPLVNWVEKGIAPDRIVGERKVSGRTLRTRPLCAYPQEQKYKGAGSIDDAASFVCEVPKDAATLPRSRF